LSAPFGCGHRAEDRSPLGQQHGSGRGERHSAVLRRCWYPTGPHACLIA
jgi:hypothetical protein